MVYQGRRSRTLEEVSLASSVLFYAIYYCHVYVNFNTNIIIITNTNANTNTNVKRPRHTGYYSRNRDKHAVKY